MKRIYFGRVIHKRNEYFCEFPDFPKAPVFGGPSLKHLVNTLPCCMIVLEETQKLHQLPMPVPIFGYYFGMPGHFIDSGIYLSVTWEGPKITHPIFV
jgi:hypothetical protein